MDVTVRKAGAADAPALARLAWRWRGEDADDRALDRASFLEFLTAWVLDHLTTHVPFLVDVDGQLSGMAWLMLGARVPSPVHLDRRTGDVQSVYVVPEMRNRGAGAALIAAILREATDRELEHVTVHSADGAVGFYQRLGFQDGQNWLAYDPRA